MIARAPLARHAYTNSLLPLHDANRNDEKARSPRKRERATDSTVQLGSAGLASQQCLDLGLRFIQRLLRGRFLQYGTDHGFAEDIEAYLLPLSQVRLELRERQLVRDRLEVGVLSQVILVDGVFGCCVTERGVAGGDCEYRVHFRAGQEVDVVTGDGLLLGGRTGEHQQVGSLEHAGAGVAVTAAGHRSDTDIEGGVVEDRKSVV